MNDLHESITQVAKCLKASSSTLRNDASVHECQSSVHFQSLKEFHRQIVALAKSNSVTGTVYVGSMNGAITVTVELKRPPARNTQHAQTATNTASAATSWFSRKRRRDPHEEKVEAAVAPIRKRMMINEAGQSSTTHHAKLIDGLDVAQRTLERLLSSLRGTKGEDVIESYALTMNSNAVDKTGNTAQLSQTAAQQQPTFIIACRLSGGVAISLQCLFSAFEDCLEDGMLTTKTATLGSEFCLPASTMGTLVERSGQKSLFCYASILINTHGDRNSDPAAPPPSPLPAHNKRRQ